MSKLLILSTLMLSMSTSMLFADDSKIIGDNTMVETIKGSMIMFTCPICQVEEEEVEIVLAPGSQTFEMRQVGDADRLYRTENWLGGSPVSYAHVSPTPEATAIALGLSYPSDTALLDETPVASIKGPPAMQDGEPKMIIEDNDPALALAVTPIEKPMMGPEIETEFKSAVAASTTALPLPEVSEQEAAIEVGDATQSVKEFDPTSFGLRLN